ncbi:LysR family transcriptional regulator [Aeromicrobium phragmitis]|uniref:LysR family transcriptional regulator n=1 Tax=Aeromicrobium phragmitis TaxID=2478914 RepID=A0A3L8PLL6_9ACTN|nr:LysR family transcriptional regulator [Aeromicrobium phragmitis]RLV56296.1 LysR family transcriptional regulator [Aeromicrobium phragmitis]
MRIQPSRLPFFLAIARNGGVLAAADALHVTPSAVSQQLTRLESEVGQPLVERTPRGVTLTPAGRELVELAENVEREINETELRLASAGDDPTGVVRLGGFQTFFSSVLAPALPRWREELYGVELQIHEGQRGELLRALRAADLEIVIVEYDTAETAPALGPAIREIPLLDDPWKLVAPAGTLAATELVELERLRTPWLGVEASAATAHAVRRVRTPLGQSTSAHTYAEYPTALALVAAGEGMTLLPTLALQGPLPDGVEVADVPGLGARRLALRHRTGRRGPSPAVTAAIDFLRDISASFQADPTTDVTA